MRWYVSYTQDAMSAFDFLSISPGSPTSDKRPQPTSRDPRVAPVPAPRMRNRVPEKPPQTSILELDKVGYVYFWKQKIYVGRQGS